VPYFINWGIFRLILDAVSKGKKWGKVAVDMNYVNFSSLILKKRELFLGEIPNRPRLPHLSHF
jgi:hypothetical protein